MTSRPLHAPHLSPMDQAALAGVLLLNPPDLDSALVGATLHPDGTPAAVYSLEGLQTAWSYLFFTKNDPQPGVHAEKWIKEKTLPAVHTTRAGPIIVTRYASGDDSEGEMIQIAGHSWLVVARGPPPLQVNYPKTPVPAPPHRKEVHMPRGSNPGFMVAKTPSPELSVVVGSKPLPTPEVIKKLWIYIKAHKLQDPNDGRFIFPDPALKAIMGGKKRVRMTEFGGLIQQHLS